MSKCVICGEYSTVNNFAEPGVPTCTVRQSDCYKIMVERRDSKYRVTVEMEVDR